MNNENETYRCELCGDESPIGTGSIVNGMLICDSCVEDSTTICRHCGERILTDDAIDENLCSSCYEEYYTSCDCCGRIIERDEAYYDDNDDRPLCSSCYNENNERLIHDYYYKPDPKFYGTPPRYYGVELEMDGAGEYSENAEALLNIANRTATHMYIKHDGSLIDGFECVSHPMTLDYHTNNMPWHLVIQKAIKMGYRSHESGECGLHVHISRNSLGETYPEQEATIARILYFYEKFWDKILCFSRRSEFQASRWAARYGGEVVNPKETLKQAKESGLGRYVAVNLSNAHTVEMRIFRGTLKYSTFIATLQMVDSICNAAISLSDEEVQSLSWDAFVKSIKPDKQYLIDYLKSRGLYTIEEV